MLKLLTRAEFTPGHWKTRNGFINASKGNNSPRELSVCYQVTGPIILSFLSNNGCKASRALHENPLRLRIAEFDDIFLPSTT